MKIAYVTEEYENQWDSFVEAHSEGRFVHLTAYKRILEETHGYKGHYLSVIDGNEILALFPFFEFQNFFGKTKCISQPFNASGGILLKEDLDKEKKETVIRVLKDFVVDFLNEQKAPYVEIHGQVDTDGLFAQHLIQKPMQKIAVLELGAYENVERKFQQRLRKDLRKEEREGVRVYEETSIESLTDKFYPLYTRYSKERHGTPSQPLSLFLSYYQYGKDHMKIFFAERKGKVTAALLGFYVHNRVQLHFSWPFQKRFQWCAILQKIGTDWSNKKIGSKCELFDLSTSSVLLSDTNPVRFVQHYTQRVSLERSRHSSRNQTSKTPHPSA